MSLNNPVTPPGIDPGTVRLVEQRLVHYVTPGPPFLCSTDHKISLTQNETGQSKYSEVLVHIDCRNEFLMFMTGLISVS